MSRFMKLVAAAGIMLAAVTASANAQVAKTVKCLPPASNKPAKPVLQTAIDASAAGKTLRLIISGTCTETIRISAGKSVVLSSIGGAGEIRGTSASSPSSTMAGNCGWSR